MNPFIAILFNLLRSVIEGISPEIREFLKESIATLEKRAKATPNRFDDMLVNLLKGLLGF